MCRIVFSPVVLLRDRNVRRLEFSDHRCLFSRTRTGWSHWVSNVEVEGLVLNANFENTSFRRMKLGRLHQLGHVLRMANSHVPFCAFLEVK